MAHPLVFGAFALWAFGIVAAVAGTRRVFALHREREGFGELADEDLPPISVLKPLKGVDEGIEENLSRFFEVDYPQKKFELLFCVGDALDPVIPLVRALISRHPNVRARLSVGALPVGLNPKINNMISAYEQARYDSILVSDSTVRIEPGLLRALASRLNDGVGIVTAIVAGTNPRGTGGYLEAVYLNTFFARWMRIAEAFGQTSVIGKTMFFRKSVAEKFGGLRGLSHYVAEDYQAGLAVRGMGLKIAILAHPVSQHIGRHRVSDFWSRHVRWGRIRKSQAPFFFFCEAFQGALSTAVIGSLAADRVGISVPAFLAFHWLVWLAADLSMMRLMTCRQGGKLALKWVAAWLLRELLAIPLWLHAALGNSIRWRGTTLTLLPGGTLETREKRTTFGKLGPVHA